MTQVTSTQRQLRSKQPFTVVEPSGRVMGFTFEEKWEVHDLGLAASRTEAYDVAASWRKDHVGKYPVV